MLFAVGVHAPARQRGTGQVQRPHLLSQTKVLQPQGVGPKRIGLNHFRAGLKVLLMHRANRVWLRQIQLVIAAVDEDAAAVQHGPHGAVAKHRFPTEKYGGSGRFQLAFYCIRRTHCGHVPALPCIPSSYLVFSG